jgi:hypothetical protein
MKRLLAMKSGIALLVLVPALIVAIPAHANSIPIDGSQAPLVHNSCGIASSWMCLRPAGVLWTTFDGNNVPTNGGTFSFNVTGFTGFSGSNYDYMGGSLYAAGKGTVLSGTLSNVVFHSSSGILTVKFSGYNNSASSEHRANGIYTQHLHIVRGGNINGYFYRRGSVGNGSIQTTVPEPGALGLLGTGLIGVGRFVRGKEMLAKRKRDSKRPAGLNPDGLYCVAQICLQGHVRSSDGCFEKGEHCSICGAACIDECQYCRAPLRGQLTHSRVRHYELPFFCHAPECGLAYPWMQDRLETARELLFDIENLSLEERDELWDLLNFVMSDPKSHFAPAKTKLICIKLANVSKASREAVLGFTAKVAAEVMRSEF